MSLASFRLASFFLLCYSLGITRVFPFWLPTWDLPTQYTYILKSTLTSTTCYDSEGWEFEEVGKREGRKSVRKGGGFFGYDMVKRWRHDYMETSSITSPRREANKNFKFERQPIIKKVKGHICPRVCEPTWRSIVNRFTNKKDFDHSKLKVLTKFKSLNFLYVPSRGTIWVNGQRISELEVAWFRKLIEIAKSHDSDHDTEVRTSREGLTSLGLISLKTKTRWNVITEGKKRWKAEIVRKGRRSLSLSHMPISHLIIHKRHFFCDANKSPLNTWGRCYCCSEWCHDSI